MDTKEETLMLTINTLKVLPTSNVIGLKIDSGETTITYREAEELRAYLTRVLDEKERKRWRWEHLGEFVKGGEIR
jgi:hypothetical protein